MIIFTHNNYLLFIINLIIDKNFDININITNENTFFN